MKGFKQQWIDERYVKEAKRIKRKSPRGRKTTISEVLNDAIKRDMRRQGLLKTDKGLVNG